jgi:hypothetical protein
MDYSVIINVDSRPENSTNEKMFNGVVDRDFLIDGVLNKRKLFNGLDAEFIVFVDEHEKLSEETVSQMREISDVLIIRKHNKRFAGIENFAAFNDLNYINAISMCRAKYIFHFDGDVCAFAPDTKPIEKMVELLEQFDYVSYPSHWSPHPTHDDSFQNKYWVSTRFFCCKRETLNIGEVIKCQLDYDYWKETYPVPRLCHWTEHILSSISHHKGKGVFYPPISYDDFILFTWENYRKGILQQLNNMPFDEVKNFVLACGGIFYPNNLAIN